MTPGLANDLVPYRLGLFDGVRKSSRSERQHKDPGVSRGKLALKERSSRKRAAECLGALSPTYAGSVAFIGAWPRAHTRVFVLPLANASRELRP